MAVDPNTRNQNRNSQNQTDNVDELAVSGLTNFGQLSPIQQLLAFLFMGFVGGYNPDDPSTSNTSNTFARILGFDGNNDDYKNFWHNNVEGGNESWKQNYDFSKFDFSGSKNALLDLIGKHESHGDYNIVYGGKHVNLTDMTVDQVLQWQRNYVNQGSPSSAAGKYQFIRGTLSSLKRELHLTGNEKFTPELQDRLATALLERRGYSDYLSGKISATKFMNNLSKEWASLPKDHTGRSYYEGDGLNKALTSPQAVMAALSAVKTQHDNPTPDTRLANVAPTDRTSIAHKTDPGNSVGTNGARLTATFDAARTGAGPAVKTEPGTAPALAVNQTPDNRPALS